MTYTTIAFEPIRQITFVLVIMIFIASTIYFLIRMSERKDKREEREEKK